MSDNTDLDNGTELPTADESEHLSKDADEMTREEIWNQMLVHLDDAQSTLATITEEMDDPPIRFQGSSWDERNRVIHQQTTTLLSIMDVYHRLHNELQTR